MNYKIIVGTVLFTLFVTLQSEAQRRRRTPFEQYTTVSFGAGTSSYVGDLAPYRTPVNTLFKTMRWNVNAAYTKHFTPHLAARLGFTWAQIFSDDEYYNRGGLPSSSGYVRNLHFRNNLKEFSVVGIYKFMGDGRSPNRRSKFTPYIFAGIALLAHNPKAMVPDTTPYEMYPKNKRWIALQPLGTEGQGQSEGAKPYSLVTYSIPFGLGFTWKINDQWNIGVEGGFRFTGSDYLDDVSTFYPNPDILKNDMARAMSNRTREQIAARTKNDRKATVSRIVYPNEPNRDPFATPLDGWKQGDYRGNAARKDALILSSFTVSYVLPTKIKCPPIR